MELITISQVSKEYGISTRTLRYYEKIGLIKSSRKEDYAYRTYDEEAVKRLNKIIILRKLRIPLKQIALILDDSNLSNMLEIFKENINELNNEIDAMTSIRDVLNIFIDKLYIENVNSYNKSDLIADKEIVTLVESLSLSKSNLKENRSMEKIENAEKVLGKINDVRIIYLPPMTVASSKFIGENPEESAQERIDKFVLESGLIKIKPDLRVLGFDNPSPAENQEQYGYEFWVTISEEMNVPEPFVKKTFSGGLYAAHCIKMGNFNEWKDFYEWIKNNSEYEIDEREPSGMSGCLEEHLNAFSYYSDEGRNQFTQIDLLMPIKAKIR